MKTNRNREAHRTSGTSRKDGEEEKEKVSLPRLPPSNATIQQSRHAPEASLKTDCPRGGARNPADKQLHLTEVTALGLYTLIYTHIYTHVYTYTHIYLYIYKYACTYISRYIEIYT